MGQRPMTRYQFASTLLFSNFTWTIRLILTSGIFFCTPTNTFQLKSLLISFPDGITYDKMQLGSQGPVIKEMKSTPLGDEGTRIALLIH